MTLQGPVAIPPPTPPPGVDVDTIINSLAPLIGGVTALIVAGVVLYAFFKSDLAAAIAARIRAGAHRRGRKLGGEWVESGDESQTAQLEERMQQMHGQIADLAERLDFAERLLAQKRERTLRAGE